MSGSSNSALSVPFPKCTLQIKHASQAIEAFKDTDNTLKLRHPLEKTLNVCILVSTASGIAQTQSGTPIVAMKMNSELDFDLEGGEIKLSTLCLSSDKLSVWPANLSVWTLDSHGKRGMRPVGDGVINMHDFLQKACAGTDYDVAATLYAMNGDKDTTPVIIRMKSTEPIQNLKDWCTKNKEVMDLLAHRTISKKYVQTRLAAHSMNRLQMTSEIINEKHGKAITDIRMLGFDPRRDLLGWVQMADSTQLNCVVDEFSKNKVVASKNMAVYATIAVHAMAEFMASLAKPNENGEKTTTMQQCISNIVKINGSAADKKSTFYGDFLRNLQQVFTVRSALYPYTPDEQYECQGELIVQVQKEAEKMDTAAGGSYLTYLKAMQQMEQNENILASKMQQLSTALPGQTELESSINALKGEQYENSNLLAGKIGKDCEDGGFFIVEGMTSLEFFPDEIYHHVESQIGTTFLKGDIETAKQLVYGSLQFASNALKAQRISEPGWTLEYRPVFGFASAPSMQAQPDGTVATFGGVTRDMFPTYQDFIAKYFDQRKINGHCYAVLAKISKAEAAPLSTNLSGLTAVPDRNLGHATISHARVELKNVLESTLCNATRSTPGTYTNKAFEIITDGPVPGTRVTSGIRVASHEIAREQIGNTMLKQMQVSMEAAFDVHRVVNLSVAGHSFYNFFAHIGSGECVVSEMLSETKTNLCCTDKTIEQLRKDVSTASFITSAIAWGASLTSNETSCALVSVPTVKEEELLIRQIAKEAAPVHSMSREQHDFLMQRTGRVISIGFEDGTFCGTDFTGEYGDTNTELVLAFTLCMTKKGASTPAIWKSDAGAKQFITNKLLKEFPGKQFHLKELETGFFALEVKIPVNSQEH
jgi:hypothetical protein